MMPYIGLIRSGSACKNAEDPELVRLWLAQKGISAHYHPDTQKWLTPQQRANILLEFLLDDRYTVLWAFRGGEGTADILPYLHVHAEAIKQAKPKLLLGMSDVTALLNYFNQVFHWPVAHASGAARVARGEVDEETVRLTLELIAQREIKYSIKNLLPLNEAASTNQTLTAQACGGNLSMLAISVKDLWEIQAADKILIIEDVNEQSFQIARYLNYLERIKLLDSVKALIFGEFLLKNVEIKATQAISRTLHRFAESCTFPVLQTKNFGHGKYCMPIPFFSRLTVSLDKTHQELRIG